MEVAAGAEEAQQHVEELAHDEADADEVAEQVIVDTQEDDDREQRAEDVVDESMTDRTELDEVTRRQERGEQTLPVAVMSTACDDGPELEEMPETVADEREQELPEYEEEKDELISLVQQPEVVEEAASDARLMGSRGKEEEDGRAEVLEVVQHSFSFPSLKRERRLSNELIALSVT